MYHRNKVHTDEFWKYEMAKHRRTVVDDKDRNDDMWQQQLGKHGKDIENKSVASGSNGTGYGGETLHLSKTDPSHDERWLQQIQRATSKETHEKAKSQPLSDVKLLALQSLQSSLHNLKNNMYTNGNVIEERTPMPRKEANILSPKHREIKDEYFDRNQASTKPSNQIVHPYAFAKTSQAQDDNYLTLLAHLSTQRKACEEQGALSTINMEKEVPMEVDESIASRDRSNIQYQAPSQHSESLCSRQRPLVQDQRSSSNSPPTLSLPDIKEESSVTRTKMWLAQLGQYRQKAVQEEMEKSHDELWEEQISRAKSSPAKSTIEPLEITIEDEQKSTKLSENSTPRHTIQSKQEKHPPLLSALQVQPAPNRASPQISTPNFSRKSHNADKQGDMTNKKMILMAASSPNKVNEWTNINSPSLSPRSSIDKMTPPLPAASPVISNPRSKDSVSFKNLLSINSSIIVNINGQNVNMRGTDDNEENTEKSRSLKSFSGRISLSTPTEANNNEPLVQQPVQERQSNPEDAGVHPRHIPLAIPPLQPSSHLPPMAKYKNEKSANINQEKEKDGHLLNEDAMNKIDNNKKTKPKYPPPDPSTFGSSSVLKMLLMDPNARKRPLSPPPNPVQNKRNPNAFSNKIGESPMNNNSADEKSTESENAFKKFYGAPNTNDDTDILRRRLLGIRDPTPQTTPQNKSVNMLMPKPKYSPPSATITSADVARKEPSLFPKKSPMAVEEFTKVAAAAATLASFNLSRLDENQTNSQNLDNQRMTKKVNFPIEVNYENYNQSDNSMSPQRFQIFQSTNQQQSHMLLEDDLKNPGNNDVMPNSKKSNDTNNVTNPVPTEPLRQQRVNSPLYRKSQDSDHNESIDKKNKSSVEESNTSAYARTSVSKQLLYRYTTHNNNNNNCDEDYNPVRRTSQ